MSKYLVYISSAQNMDVLPGCHPPNYGYLLTNYILKSGL